MAGEVIVDALPYIDQGYDEAGVREAALAMVEEETRRYRPTKNYLEHLPPLNISQFETEMMKSEWERMQQRQPMDVLSMKRYELPPPPPGKMTDIAAWTECVENSLAQLEHQTTRICNLELMVEFGCEAWKTYLELLVASVSQAQKNLQTLRKEIQEINWERKSAQMKGGEKLRELEATWVGLVSKNYDIEQACVTLEEEIAIMLREKEYGAKRRRQTEERAAAKRRKIEQEQQRERENEQLQIQQQLFEEAERQNKLEKQRQKELEEQRLKELEEQRQKELNEETEAQKMWPAEPENAQPLESNTHEEHDGVFSLENSETVHSENKPTNESPSDRHDSIDNPDQSNDSFSNDQQGVTTVNSDD